MRKAIVCMLYESSGNCIFPHDYNYIYISNTIMFIQRANTVQGLCICKLHVHLSVFTNKQVLWLSAGLLPSERC